MATAGRSSAPDGAARDVLVVHRVRTPRLPLAPHARGVRAPRADRAVPAAARGEPDWDAIYGDYTATVDWPGAAFWRELAAAFPDAKVLLSERDSDRWYESFSETIYHPIVNGGFGVIDDMVREVIVERELGGGIDDREHVIAAFERHNAEVRAEIPAERLLVFRPDDGWEPLCAFLDRPVPDEPFPHVNDRESFRNRNRYDCRTRPLPSAPASRSPTRASSVVPDRPSR